MIKILFTSVGRRVELIQAFREAALELDIELEVWGADLSNTAPALFFCNKTVQVCRIHDKEYIPQLLNICQQENINLLIPTIDTDLLLLAKNKDKFEKIGTKVLISDYDSIALCRDKRLTSKFFMECGLKTPETFDQVEKYVDRFPCFIKPKDGSSSINAFKVNDRQELIEYSKRIQDYIIQPFIKGKEYTVDICCDFEGKDIYLIPRERVAVRSGEVLKTKIIKDKQIELECEEIVRKFRPCGPITVQLIQEESTGDNYYIEINPRFGGGAPLSMKAGGNSAKVILELLSGKTVLQEKILIGNTYSRFDQSIVISEEKGKRQIERISEVETYLEDYDGIIFDLDDTLYSEKEYIRSGYHEIAKVMPQIVNCENRLWQHFQQGKQAINELLMEENCYTEENLKLCLDAYREQVPDIHLYDGIKELLYALKK